MATPNLPDYFEKIEKIIKSILLRPAREDVTYNMFETSKSKQRQMDVLKEKQLQMKIGEIIQAAIGNYDDYEDLKIGHESGLDCISRKKKIIIEIKTRPTTDNASSRKSNKEKLRKFKQHNPEYRCIYAYFQANTEKKTIEGSHKLLIKNGIVIEELIGSSFYNLIFGDNSEQVISFIKSTIDENYL
jgi:hypothetical protein